jgi:predicted GNAT family N-acyltransferase
VIEVIELDAEATHPLRRAVLRNDTPDDRVVFDGDDEPSTFHLGAMLGGELVTISTWLSRRYPDLPEHAGHQLRGMATSPTVRGSGAAGLVLVDGLRRCAERGSTVVWARARVTAVGFYERHGFETRGEEYTDLTTGLPHRDIVRLV